MNELNNSIITTLKTDFSDTVTSVGEVGLDALLNDGALKDLPIIGTIFSIAKASVSIRDIFFIKKIVKFLTSLNDTTTYERELFFANHSDPLELGEKLIYTIEKLDDLEKPEFIANLFKHYMHSEIDNITFQRLSLIIERCFVEDLKFLKRNCNNIMTGVEAIGLANNGLVDLASFDLGTFNEVDYNPKTDYKINDLGKAIIEYAF